MTQTSADLVGIARVAAAAVDADTIADVGHDRLVDRIGMCRLMLCDAVALVLDPVTVRPPESPIAALRRAGVTDELPPEAIALDAQIVESHIAAAGDLFVRQKGGGVRSARVHFMIERRVDAPVVVAVGLLPGDVRTSAADAVFVPTIVAGPAPDPIRDPGDEQPAERRRLLAEHLSRPSVHQFRLASTGAVDDLVKADGRRATHYVGVGYDVDPAVMERTFRTTPAADDRSLPLHGFEARVTVHLEADGANPWSITFPAFLELQFVGEFSSAHIELATVDPCRVTSPHAGGEASPHAVTALRS